MSSTTLAEDDDPLRGLRHAADLRRQAARFEAAQVRAARVAGLTWKQIARALDQPTGKVRARYAGHSARLRRAA